SDRDGHALEAGAGLRRVQRPRRAGLQSQGGSRYLRRLTMAGGAREPAFPQKWREPTPALSRVSTAKSPGWLADRAVLPRRNALGLLAYAAATFSRPWLVSAGHSSGAQDVLTM